MNIRHICIGLVFACIATLMLLRGSIPILAKPWGTSGDIAYEYFIVDHNIDYFFSNTQSDFFITRMFYPMAYTFTFGSSMMAQTFFAIPIYAVTTHLFSASHQTHLFFAANLALFAIVATSFFSLYHCRFPWI